MTAGNWSRVKALFEEALRLPAKEREVYVKTQDIDEAVRIEVLSLLAVYEESPGFLEEPAGSPLAGRRIGSWELVRELGRGGMGVVWEARRADQEYEQRAAIKLLPLGFLSPADVARFRGERQILASLNHPGIARLLDGGTAEDGSPYLVMEYIQGEPLDSWCENRKLGLRERLGLFLSVCVAVEYAHRHLVVHRDLKPANILVTAEGTPKLLDFGIARLLEAEGQAGATRTGAGMLTPEYASPEQVRGDPMTTATDVYSLGVLLYVLLAGSRPYGKATRSPIDLARAVCEEDAGPPSASAPAERRGLLKGALDAVVLQALRKEPEERYPSVRALADDIRAWLGGRPVGAHAEGAWRRALKFVRRHKAQSAAAGLAVISLVTGATVSLWQAHVAGVERTRSESRFRQVRQFSRSLLFELDESIRNLPGATPSRKLLLARATEFLDGLARDAGSDAALKVELAEGYRRLGHVQGSALSDNLGQPAAAVESYRKAVRLGEEVLTAIPNHLDAAIVLLGAYEDLTGAFQISQNEHEADRWFGRHRDLLARMVAGHPGDNEALASAASSYSALGYYQVQRNGFEDAKALYGKSVELFANLVNSGYDSKELRAQYPFALKRLGAILINDNRLEDAERYYCEALRMEEAALAKDRENVRVKLDRTYTLADIALIKKHRKDIAGAVALYREVVETRKAALEADPDNVRLMNMTASAESKLAELCSVERRHEEAIHINRDALRWWDKAAEITKSPRDYVLAALGRIALSERLLDAAEGAPRRSAAGRGVAEADALLRQAGRLAGGLRQRQSLSPLEKSVLADYAFARQRLQIALAAR